METYRLEIERMEKQREHHEDKQDCHHHELIIKKSSPQITRSISYLTNDDNSKEHDERDNDEDKEECKNDNSKDKSDKSDESTVLQISQGALFYQEEGFKMSPKTHTKT
eukprot:9385211-Ditylum_brightwellii.AAC.1